jgi:hypothetical protein
MCQFLSAVVLKNGDVLHHPILDSHSEIVEHFKLPDATAHHQHFAKVELTPPPNWDGWEDVSRWAFRLDEDTAPGWWEDVAIQAEASVRAIVSRAILPQGEYPFLLDGLALIGPGVTVRSIKNGRGYVCGGTVSEIRGGTVNAIRGGTVNEIRGGTVSEIRGGTVSEISDPYGYRPRILSVAKDVKLNKAARDYIKAQKATR